MKNETENHQTTWEIYHLMFFMYNQDINGRLMFKYKNE